MSNYTQLVNSKGFKLRLFIVVVASILILVKLHDPLLPGFIAISQAALIVYDFWKLRSGRKKD